MNGRVAVLRLRDVTLALMASLSLCVLPGSHAFAGPIALSSILDIDPLGYRCIPSRYFDDNEDGSAAVAFSLSGKTRLPRTCLPDPCARALTPQELSQITGTEPILARFSDEWDDYYSRYADHCRREIVVSRPNTNIAFWKPIIDRSRVSQRVGLPTSSRLTPFLLSNEIPVGPGPILVRLGDPVTGGGVLPAAIPSPVPLPASGWMLAAVLGAGAFAARRRRRKVNV